MYDVRLFPLFRPSANSTILEKQFLDSILYAKDESGAKYVNFSCFQYEEDDTTDVHYVTYPMDWITHYIHANYIQIDPLFLLDYRRVTALDWRDIRKDGPTRIFFDDFEQRGLGNQGLILTTALDSKTFGVTHFCFDVKVSSWDAFRAERIEQLRLIADQLAFAYSKIFRGDTTSEHKITRREKQCLYWVAMGKTDEEIGDLLAIGKWTVVSHLKSAKFKLDCSNRASAVAKALADGIIDIRNPENN